MSEQLLKIIRPGCLAEAASHWAEQWGWQRGRRAWPDPPAGRGPAARGMAAARRRLGRGGLGWVPLPLPWGRRLFGAGVRQPVRQKSHRRWVHRREENEGGMPGPPRAAGAGWWGGKENPSNPHQDAGVPKDIPRCCRTWWHQMPPSKSLSFRGHLYLKNNLLLFLPLRTCLCDRKKVAPKSASFSLTVLRSFIFHYPQSDFQTLTHISFY